MKKLLLIVGFLFLANSLNASELSEAYKKEYTFLKAQKEELLDRLEKEKLQQSTGISSANKNVEMLRKELISVSDTLKTKQKELIKLKEQLSEKKENKDIVGNVILQAKTELSEYDVTVNDNNKTSQMDVLKQAFEDTIALYNKLSSLHNVKGKFYLPNGTKVDGDIVKVGNIAAYGISQKASGALAPSGAGAYKLWNAVGSSNDAKALYAGEKIDSINIFVYENLDKEVEYKKEKTFMDTMKAGGVIGYIIFGLGLFGLILLLLRVLFLMKSGSNVEKITKIVSEKLQNGRKDEALEAVKKFDGSAARVIKATLRNLGRDRDHVEDVVMENILNESSQIDRFGAFVLVIAAVAPLLGLLGTVTGMITTFDVITEYGTGDPKMLSGGISAALVTTMQGLIVAIPLLLLGNLLSGWAQKIKDSMEQSALHIVNIYEKFNVRS